MSLTVNVLYFFLENLNFLQKMLAKSGFILCNAVEFLDIRVNKKGAMSKT